MITVIEKGKSPILIVGETFEKNSTETGAFSSDEANVALKIGIQTNFPTKYIDPHFIDLKRENLDDTTHAEFTPEVVQMIHSYIMDNSIELVVCMGRTTMSLLFPSLVGKGKSLAKLVQSPFIEGLEIPEVKACCIYSYSQAYDKNNENALQEYWGRLKEIFIEKPTYNVPEVEIRDEDELIALLDYFDSLPKNTKFGLDYETNAVQQFHEDYETTMIGLAYLQDKNTAPSFWFPLDLPPSEKLVTRMAKFFDDNHSRIWTHNCVFEILSSWHEFGKHWEFQDTLVLLTVQGKRASLKDAMRNHLGATLWESSVTEFREKTEALYKWLEKSKARDEIFNLAESKNWEELRNYHSKLKDCIDWVVDNYSEEQLPRVFKAFPYPWASVPPEVLGPYCAKDAGYTVLLSEYMWKPEMEMVYQFSLPHPYLAAKFEANGSKWNDSIAKEVEKDIVDKLLDTLYFLIQNLDTISVEDKMMAKDTYFKELPYDVVSYTEKTKKEKRRTISTKLDKVNELKSILNLGSNTPESRAKFWDCYFTEELQMGTILNATLEDLEFNQCLESLLNLLQSVEEGFSFQKRLPSKSLEILANIENYIPDTPENKPVISQVARSLNVGIDKLPELSGKYASDVVKNQYVIHTRYLGVDINDETTWSKEFKLLFNLFYHKKLAKTLSTNINGTIGRSIVYEIVGEKNGIPLRGKSISEKPDLVEGLMDNSFNPLSADTWRWSSGYHCLVGDTEILMEDGSSEKIENLVGLKRLSKRTLTVLKGKSVTKPIHSVVESFRTKELVEVLLENGEVIRCTPNHRFLCREGYYVQAKDLMLHPHELLEVGMDQTPCTFLNYSEAENWIKERGFDLELKHNGSSQYSIQSRKTYVEVIFSDVLRYTIYGIQEKATGKWYIGMTNRLPEDRILEHFSEYGFAGRGQFYGRSRDEFNIVPEIDFVVGSKKQALQLESNLIEKYQAVENGFNAQKVPFESVDKSKSGKTSWSNPESRKILLEERKSRFKSEEYRTRHIANYTTEVKQQMSQSVKNWRENNPERVQEITRKMTETFHTKESFEKRRDINQKYSTTLVAKLKGIMTRYARKGICSMLSESLGIPYRTLLDMKNNRYYPHIQPNTEIDGYVYETDRVLGNDFSVRILEVSKEILNESE